jgi:hypothetical protein
MIWHARRSLPRGRSHRGRASIMIATRKAVFAMRAQSSRVSVDNNSSTRGGSCHEGAVIAGERQS